MAAVHEAIQSLLDLGPSVMMPIIITILGLIFGQKFSKAIRSGLTVGIGFIGINLVIGLLMNNLGPASQAMVENFGFQLDALDVGWPVGAAIAFGTKIGATVFIVGLLTNFVMLFTGLTKTLDVDLWNYWHWALGGSLVYYHTGNFTLGIITVVLMAAYTLVMADRTAPVVQEFFNMPGISISHGWAMASIPIVWPVAKLLDAIPGLKDIDADPESIKKRFGALGEPVVLGVVLGAIIAILAGYNWKQVLQVAVAMAGVFVLLPRVVAILMEGLVPLSEAARKFLQTKFKGRKINIGMDSAILLGHPTTLAAALVLVPITLILAVILPGNRLLPFGDLAATPFFAVMATPFARGNVVKTIIIGTVIMAVIMLMGTDWAPVVTQAAQDVGFEFPEGAAIITNFGNPISWLLWRITSLFA